MIELSRLEAILARLPSLAIALVGDLFLDRYLEIDSACRELSVETGLEAYQVSRVRNSPGALGTVINNLAALGVGRLVPVTVIGDDGEAYDLLKVLAPLPVDATHIVRDPSRKTPTYTKPLKQDDRGVWQELNRLDLRDREPISAATEQVVLDDLATVFAHTDGLIVLDQVSEEGWGVVTPRVREHLTSLANNQPDKLIFVDSRSHIARFRCGVLKANLSECFAAVGQEASHDASVRCSAAAQLARISGRRLFCTLGEDGIMIVEPDGATVHVRGYRVDGPIDIVGAGDSATSGIVVALLAGATSAEAAAVGNLVASITVQQLGTTGTASPRQVLDRWRQTHPDCRRTQPATDRIGP